MRTIVAQRVASTNLDKQGERLSRSFLENYANALVGIRQPLHDKHDMTRPTVGFVENYRLVPDERNAGEWILVADIHIEDQCSLEDYNGFSISGVEMIHTSEEADARILIAYPYYLDQTLVDELCATPQLDVGKWIRKGADEFQWGVLFGSMLAFAITPIWDDVYKRKIAPRIDEVLRIYMEKLKPRGVGAEVIQHVIFQDNEVEVRFIPERGLEAICLRSEVVGVGLKAAIDFLARDGKSVNIGVNRIVVFFDIVKSAYVLHRIEYGDGSVEHIV